MGSNNSIIQQIEAQQLEASERRATRAKDGKDAKAGKEGLERLPAFSPGDTVVVQVKIREGERERLQAFEGVVIGRRKRGLNSSFTVRKISHGVGVERTFQTHSPLVESVKILRRGDVRQAKLYYLRKLAGRAARISEKLEKKAE